MKTNPKLCGADTLEAEMNSLGYVRSPNNIHGLPSVHSFSDDPMHGASPIWYAGAGGLPDPGEGIEVQVASDRIRLFRVEFVGLPYSRCSYHDTRTVAVFDSVDGFLAWCKLHGRDSLPGANYGYID